MKKPRLYILWALVLSVLFVFYAFTAAPTVGAEEPEDPALVLEDGQNEPPADPPNDPPADPPADPLIDPPADPSEGEETDPPANDPTGDVGKPDDGKISTGGIAAIAGSGVAVIALILALVFSKKKKNKEEK